MPVGPFGVNNRNASFAETGELASRLKTTILIARAAFITATTSIRAEENKNMTESAAKEQIAYTIIDVLLCLEQEDKARQQIFQILSKENSPNIATARCMIKDALRDNGHAVDHERIQMCIDTFQQLTNGFARWVHEPSEDDKELISCMGTNQNLASGGAG